MTLPVPGWFPKEGRGGLPLENDLARKVWCGAYSSFSRSCIWRTLREGEHVPGGSSARVSFRFPRLFDQIVKALVVPRPGDRAVCRKFGKERLLPQEQLTVLFFV